MNSLTVKRQCELAKWANIVNECNNSGFTVTEWLAAHNNNKCLKPVAWLYQACRITGIIIGRLFKGKSVKGAGELAGRQDELFRALEIGKYRG